MRPNAVTSISRGNNSDSYGYDANGAMTSRTIAGATTTLDWDELGKLTNAATSGQNTQMVYDADGNRIIRRTPPPRQYHVTTCTHR